MRDPAHHENQVRPTLPDHLVIVQGLTRVPKAGLKFQVTALVCQVTGGPQVYTGRSMADAHHHLHITEVEWAAMVRDFVETLDRFGVPKPEQQELLAIVATTQGDIVRSPAAAR